jgi:hypothetical protein
MRKRFAALLLLGWLIPAGLVWAEPPVTVSHTLTGYTMGANTVTLSYTLHAKNAGTGSVSNLTLSLLSVPVVTEEQLTLNIATLEPQEEVHIPFTLTALLLREQNFFQEMPLLWECEGVAAGLDPVRFPVISIGGGAL